MDNHTDQPKIDSRMPFTGMMQLTKLLIMDYDVLRYHSFDYFRHLVRDHALRGQCDPKLLELIHHTNLGEQIRQYKRFCPNLTPYDNFSTYRNQMVMTEYENHLNGDLSKLVITPTDLGKRLGVVFERKTITGYVLRYTHDPYEIPYKDIITEYRSDHVMDLRMALAIIEKHGINAVMVASVDLAIILAYRLIDAGITRPMSMIIGSYGYNLDPETGMLRRVQEMFMYEQRYKYEFGMFEPYTGLQFNTTESEGDLHE